MTNALKVVALNSLICIFQSAVNSNLNIITQVTSQNDYKSLGNISIFLIFGFGMIGTLIAPLYIKKLKYNLVFFLHALGYLFFLLEGILVCYCDGNRPDGICSPWLIWILVLVGSSISGFASSGFWISQNEFISEASNDKNVGLLFGIGWALVQFSQVLGSIYSAFIVEPLGQLNFFYVMILIAAISSLGFLCVPQPASDSKNKVDEINQSSIEVNPFESNLDPRSSNDMGEIASLLSAPKIQLLLFPMMLTGIMLSFQWNLMHLLIENSIDTSQKDETINSLTFKVMISLGIMEVIGGLVSGVLNSYYPKIKVMIFVNLLFEIALIMGLTNSFIQNYSLCFLVASVWGFVDCSTTTSLLALLSENFKNDVRVYSLFNCMQCLGGMIATIISLFLQNYSLQYSLTVILVAQMAANMCIQAWDRFPMKSKL